MQEFSLEKISERIHFGNTKEYFSEALSSYYNKNYRSSVVMLWSVAVCDIVYKLQHLIDLYGDARAKEILETITNIQEQDSKSSAWEIRLLDEAFTKTDLLNGVEYENLRYLQIQRHLSAHPVLNNRRELHSPNKETVRSLLRNTLESLLIKPPFYTKKIIEEFLQDLSENLKALNTQKKTKRYIESRYLSRLTPDVEFSLFRSLWKLVFKLDNADCNKNRVVNFYALRIISVRLSRILVERIVGDKDYFSNIASKDAPLNSLIVYLASTPDVYSILSEDAQLKIQYDIEKTRNSKFIGWFIKESLEEHYAEIIEWLEGDEHPSFEEPSWVFLLKISDTDEWQSLFCRIVSVYYGKSLNYNEANIRFNVVIDPYLNLFNIENIDFLLAEIEKNDQVYRRGRAYTDHDIIKKRALELNDDYDFSVFPNFLRTVEDE